MPGSRAFQAYRALGYVSDTIPFALQARGQDHFVTTVIGRSFHVYNCDKLRLLFVGQQNESSITALAVLNDDVFTAIGGIIRTWQRGRMTSEMGNKDEADIIRLLPFGSDYLIALDEVGTIRIWNTEDQSIYTTFSSDNVFNINDFVHPSTYLNKLLLGSREGSLKLWNLRSNKIVYVFSGWGSAITSLCQSTAVDVIGVGCEDGSIRCHNIKYDITLMTFNQDGPVTGLAFRLDGNTTLASSNTSGQIALWGLESKRLITVLNNCHDGSVVSLRFFASQPIMITSGSDNSVKMWVFDQEDETPRLLRLRSGHSAPPLRARFYDKTGMNILSAGLDKSLRNFSTIREAQNCELSQGSTISRATTLGVSAESVRLPAVTAFAFEELRGSSWDNVVTCHAGESGVRTWRYDHKVVGKHILLPLDAATNHMSSGTGSVSHGGVGVAKTVAVTACGNFALVGMDSGRVDMYNMQSGKHRGAFLRSKSLTTAHDGALTGVAVDSLNQTVLTSALDSSIRFWSFKDRTLNFCIDTESPVAHLQLHRDSSLVAAACDDLAVRIYDIDTRRLVRRLEGRQSARITDVTFSPDARWLVTSSMDATICVWDVPSGRAVDWFSVECAVTSLSFSPGAGSFLITTHVDNLGLYLWANRTLFGDATLPPLPPNSCPSRVALPVPGGGRDTEDAIAIDEDGNDDIKKSSWPPLKSGAQLDPLLITLSETPRARWAMLVDLDAIKENSCPDAAPVAKKSAPFFLRTTKDLVPTFIIDEDQDKTATKSTSRVINFGSLASISEFVRRLRQSTNTGSLYAKGTEFEGEWEGENRKRKYDSDLQFDNLDPASVDEFTTFIKSMTPSALDLELRTMPLDNDLRDLRLLLLWIIAALKSRRDFEVLQSVLNLVLKLHGSVLTESEIVRPILLSLLRTQRETWGRFEELLHNNLCLVRFMKSTAIQQ